MEIHFLESGRAVVIDACIDHCNNQPYHECIGNLTFADVTIGRDEPSWPQGGATYGSPSRTDA